MSKSLGILEGPLLDIKTYDYSTDHGPPRTYRRNTPDQRFHWSVH